MANDVIIEFNRNGKRSLLRSPGTRACVLGHAMNVKERADEMSASGVANYVVVSDVHKISAHAHVWARDAATIQSNLKNDSLIKALSAEPGVTMHAE